MQVEISYIKSTPTIVMLRFKGN